MYKDCKRLIEEWAEMGNADMVMYFVWLLGWCTGEDYELFLARDLIALDHVAGDVLDQRIMEDRRNAVE